MPMAMSDAISIGRRLEFPPPILQLAQRNPIVDRFLSEYACCAILTREEALMQMVIALAREWHRDLDETLKMAWLLGVTVPPSLEPKPESHSNPNSSSGPTSS